MKNLKGFKEMVKPIKTNKIFLINKIRIVL